MLALGVALSVYLLRPDLLLDAHFAMQRSLAGLSTHAVEVDGARWTYDEGGSGEPVLLLHGMAGSKENWYLVAPYLKSDFHLYVPDQAGFGGSEAALDGDYRISAQVERLRAFADAMHLQRMHLVGHSMGGHIAGVFAARYPQRVASLSLISSAGVPFKRNAFQAILESGKNPFATESLEKFDQFMAMIFEKPPFIPARMRQVYAEHNAHRADLWSKILRRITSEKSRYYLQQKLPLISAPTLVLWCDRDQLLDVSSVDAFRAGLPDARIEVLKGCGHMPTMEQPQATAELLRSEFALAPIRP